MEWEIFVIKMAIRDAKKNQIPLIEEKSGTIFKSLKIINYTKTKL